MANVLLQLHALKVNFHTEMDVWVPVLMELTVTVQNALEFVKTIPTTVTKFAT